MASDATLNRLRSQHPEWAPWLAVVELALRDGATREWDAAVPTSPVVSRPMAPLLSQATVAVPASGLDRLVRALIGTAAASGTPAMTTLASTSNGELDALGLFRASLCQDRASISQLAEASGADADAFQAVAALVAVPFLHACHREWALSLPKEWVQGYCPLCGGWPAFTEVRGIERSRHHRCGRCGCAWHARLLSCPFCGMLDHDRLVSLVPEKGGAGSVEACVPCHGYVKTFTRLQGCSPDEVMLEDLASVDLDIAALENGYSRPPDAGYALGVEVIAAGAGRLSASRP